MEGPTSSIKEQETRLTFTNMMMMMMMVVVVVVVKYKVLREGGV